MTRLRTKARSAQAAAAAFCLAAGLCAAAPAQAQDLGALRGPIAGPASDTALLPPAQGTASGAADPVTTSAIASGPYRPESAGAVPDAAGDTGGLSGADDDLTFMTAAPTPSRTTTTARARREARRGAEAVAEASPEPEGAQAQADDGDIGRELRMRRAAPVETAENEAARRTNLPEGSQDAAPPASGADDPFAPVGLRVGTFRMFPRLEHGLTATDNADQSTTGSSAILSETTLRLRAASDWSRHSAGFDAYGTFRKTLSGQEISELKGGLSSELTLDIRSDLRGLARLEYSLAPEDASSPVSIAGTSDRPLHHVIAGSLGAEKDIGRLRLRLTGDLVRDQYADADLDDGTTLSQDDRNETLAAVRLRGGYQLSPALTPFVEAEFGKRIYDRSRDAAGYARSALRSGARAGIALDIEEKLTGELSAGWIHEDPEDGRLDAVSGPTVAASLAWSPLRGTMVRLDASTLVEGTTTPGESGSILHYGLLTAERQMRANLTGSVALGFGWRSYDVGGHDALASAEAGLTWWLNRHTGVTGRARYELMRSDLPNRDYDAASIFLGMTMQR